MRVNSLLITDVKPATSSNSTPEATNVSPSSQTAYWEELEYESLFQEAVREYKTRMVQGLNRLTNDEIQERIAKFKAKFKPEDGTAEELALFEKALAKYIKSLKDLANNQSVETLIRPSNEDRDSSEAATRGLLLAKLPSNPKLSQQLQAKGVLGN